MNFQNIFDAINNFIRETEGSVANLLASIAPWGAPIPAAVMSFMHMREFLGFSGSLEWVSWVTAATIEVLGFSTISTALSFYQWNKKYTSDKSLKKAPMGFVILAFGFYLGVVISMNVLLDASKYFPDVLSQNLIIVFVRATITLLTIPAGLIVATRVQHNDLLDDMRKSKFVKVSQTLNPAVNPAKIISWRSFKKTINNDEIGWISTAQIPDLMAKYNLIYQTAMNWQACAKRDYIVP